MASHYRKQLARPDLDDISAASYTYHLEQYDRVNNANLEARKNELRKQIKAEKDGKRTATMEAKRKLKEEYKALQVRRQDSCLPMTEGDAKEKAKREAEWTEKCSLTREMTNRLVKRFSRHSSTEIYDIILALPLAEKQDFDTYCEKVELYLMRVQAFENLDSHTLARRIARYHKHAGRYVPVWSGMNSACT